MPRKKKEETVKDAVVEEVKETKKKKEEVKEEPKEEVVEEVKEEVKEEPKEEVKKEEVKEEPKEEVKEPVKEVVKETPKVIKRTNGFALAGLLLSIFGGIFLTAFGFIFCIIGLFRVKKCNSGTGMSIAGIIIAILKVVFLFIMLFVISAIITSDAFEERFCLEMEKRDLFKEACIKKGDNTYDCYLVTCKIDDSKKIDYEVKEEKNDSQLYVNGEKVKDVKGTNINVTSFDSFLIAEVHNGYFSGLYLVNKKGESTKIDLNKYEKEFGGKLQVLKVNADYEDNELKLTVSRSSDGYTDWYCHLDDLKLNSKTIAEYEVIFEYKNGKLSNEKLGDKKTIDELYRDKTCDSANKAYKTDTKSFKIDGNSHELKVSYYYDKEKKSVTVKYRIDNKEIDSTNTLFINDDVDKTIEAHSKEVGAVDAIRDTANKDPYVIIRTYSSTDLDTQNYDYLLVEMDGAVLSTIKDLSNVFLCNDSIEIDGVKVDTKEKPYNVKNNTIYMFDEVKYNTYKVTVENNKLNKKLDKEYDVDEKIVCGAGQVPDPKPTD